MSNEDVPTNPAASRVEPRERTFTWTDPKAMAHLGTGLSGIDFLRMTLDGRLPVPPALAALGIVADQFEVGRAVMRLEPAEFHYNPIGTVHGGVLATLLDSVMGCAVHSTLPVGRAYTTLEIKVNFLRAVRAGNGEILAEGKTLHVGRQTALAEGRLTDRRGRLVATATTTCLLISLPSKAAVESAD